MSILLTIPVFGMHSLFPSSILAHIRHRSYGDYRHWVTFRSTYLAAYMWRGKTLKITSHSLYMSSNWVIDGLIRLADSFTQVSSSNRSKVDLYWLNGHIGFYVSRSNVWSLIARANYYAVHNGDGKNSVLFKRMLPVHKCKDTLVAKSHFDSSLLSTPVEILEMDKMLAT